MFSCKFAAYLPEAWSFIKKEAQAQLFSCEFCEVAKNTFYIENLR